MKLFLRGATALLALAVSLPALADDATWNALRSNTVVLVRHADAPGVGDPRGFKLDDCRTQRNLGTRGKAQARALGAMFRAHDIPVARVLTSQWCRTRETAALAFPGAAAEDEPAFNSFFDHAADEPRQTELARDLLLHWMGPGVLVVVTHQVNITALTGIVPAAGEAVVLQPECELLREVGRVTADR